MLSEGLSNVLSFECAFDFLGGGLLSYLDASLPVWSPFAEFEVRGFSDAGFHLTG